MGNRAVMIACLVVLSPAFVFGEEPAPGVVFEQEMKVYLGGKPWISTLVSPFQTLDPENTCRVYTHLYDFSGVAPITKGPGGKYPHHRGVFIGWSHTLVNNVDFNTWQMAPREDPVGSRRPSQQFVRWLETSATESMARQVALIHWKVEGEAPFIEEERSLTVFSPEEGTRALDFVSTLKATKEPVQLRGDPQHAGMHVRMVNEVVDNESETFYVLPEGAQPVGEDVVAPAWWVCASMPIGGKRYWVMHMTAPSLVTGAPQYSIRKYGRLGAFFEPDVTVDAPLRLAFRIVWSEKELDGEACSRLYREYCSEGAGNS